MPSINDEVNDCDAANKSSYINQHWTKLFEGRSAFAQSVFQPGIENRSYLEQTKVLVVGAGGLGCELLKNLSMDGFRDIHVIDMDTIDVTNLNRQFLFRNDDVGKYKAQAAADFINRRVPVCNVTPHNCKIQDKSDDFYRQFNLIICGLDSISARRWLNATIMSLTEYNDDKSVSFMIPLIDGGTEGFKGSARVILPDTACVECTIDLYPPQVNFPLCTIAHTPRLPEHCIEYVKVILWEKEKPFHDAQLDADNPTHVKWVHDAAMNRADEYGIRGINYRLVQGVLKRIIPAVASTNAIIAASCSLEAVKLATGFAKQMNNYLNFNNVDGIYMGVVALDKLSDCIVCSNQPQNLKFSDDSKLSDLIQLLTNKFQMKNPSIRSASRTLYMMNKSIETLEQLSRENLKKSLKELDIVCGDELTVADETLRQTAKFRIQLIAVPMDTTMHQL